MNPRVGIKWARALESGDYLQGEGYLKEQFPSGHTSYCCWGVLCELYNKEFPGVLRIGPSDFWARCIMYDGHSALPPKRVLDWAEIEMVSDSVHRPAIKLPYYTDARVEEELPSTMNDELHMSFSEIAEAIRNYLRGGL